MIQALLVMACWYLFPGIMLPGEKQPFIYDLGHPDLSMVLSTELREISGIRFYQDKILAVEDEHGVIYVLNSRTGEIESRWEFWDDGDFEDLTVHEGKVYVIKSNGNIYVSECCDGTREGTVKYDLKYGKSHNFEGIDYNPKDNCFLIAAKRSSSDNQKEIYCQPADDMEIVADPVYMIDQSVVRDHYRSEMDSWSDRLAFDLGMAAYSLNPSGLAIHPVTGDIYILSSPVPQLLVLTSKWEFHSVEFLDRDLYKQPEAICFDPQGNLYIANEGRSGRGNILKFDPQ